MAAESSVEYIKWFLSDNRSIFGAFVPTFSRHPNIPDTRTEAKEKNSDEMFALVQNLFFNGIAYLTMRGYDQYIREIGEVTWWTASSKRALLIMTNNAFSTETQPALEQEPAFIRLLREGKPNVMININRQNQIVKEKALILLSPEFAIEAKYHPVETLAALAGISSQIRDFANGIHLIDKPINIKTRADASEAHFLKLTKQHHRFFTLNQHAQDLLTRYPSGIGNLPKSLAYKGGASGTESQFASFN